MHRFWVTDLTGAQHEIEVDGELTLPYVKQAVGRALDIEPDTCDLYYEERIVDNVQDVLVADPGCVFDMRASKQLSAKLALKDLQVHQDVSQLVTSIQSKNVEVAVLLLDAGVEFVTDNWCALHESALEGDCSLVQKILEEHPELITKSLANDANTLKGLPIHCAGSAAVVDALVAFGADVNSPLLRGLICPSVPLMTAAARGARGAVEALLRHNADIKDVTLASIPVMGSEVDTDTHEILTCLRLLIDAGAALNDELFPVLMHPEPDYVEFFIEMGADVNSTFDTCPVLMSAAARNSRPCAEVFLNAGAEIDKQCSKGNTALFVALWYQSQALTSYLIEKGTALHHKNKQGKQPIHIAATMCVAVDVLCDLKCDANAKDSAGLTPLHYAASAVAECQTDRVIAGPDLVALGSHPGAPRDAFFFPDCPASPSPSYTTRGDVALAITRLHTSGADLNSRCDSGYTPLHIAAAQGMTCAVQVLVRLGADRSMKCRKGMTAEQLAGGNGHFKTLGSFLPK